MRDKGKRPPTGRAALGDFGLYPCTSLWLSHNLYRVKYGSIPSGLEEDKD